MSQPNMALMEFTTHIGYDHATDMVAIYNRNHISDEDVRIIIEEGTQSRNVIVVTKQQYDRVFGDSGFVQAKGDGNGRI